MNKPKEIDKAMIDNNATYADYLGRLTMLATSIFTWKNLDKVCGFGAERFLEHTLFEEGRACFVDDPEIGVKVFKVAPNNKLNVYDLPTSIRAYSHEYQKDYEFDDIVYVMNNNLVMPTIYTISQIAYRLYETERTIDTNLIAQKTPVLIEGDHKSIMTLRNVYEQYSGNTPFIFGNKQFDISNKLNVLKTDAPYIVDNLTTHKRELWTEALTYLGIDNFYSSKKERLVSAEATSTEELTNYYLNCFFKTRKEACDMLNEKFCKPKGLPLVELTVNKSEIAKLKEELSDIIEGRNEREQEVLNNE